MDAQGDHEWIKGRIADVRQRLRSQRLQRKIPIPQHVNKGMDHLSAHGPDGIEKAHLHQPVLPGGGVEIMLSERSSQVFHGSHIPRSAKRDGSHPARSFVRGIQCAQDHRFPALITEPGQ